MATMWSSSPCAGTMRRGSINTSTSLTLPALPLGFVGSTPLQPHTIRNSFPESQSRRVHCKATTSTSTEDRISTQSIDNLSTEPYCDDFQCTSSPAVEATVRSFARDLTRLRYTQSLFNKDCKYTDGMRTFQGSDKYARQRWYAENIQKPSVTISRMQMLDKGTAQLEWRVTGQLGSSPVDIGVTSVISMNLLTGRISDHKETWDLSRLPPSAATMARLGRMAWSATQASKDASENVAQKMSESLSSLDGSSDKQQEPYFRDPTDPTKFFQNNQDNQWNDYVSYALLAAVMYLVYRGFGEIASL